MKLSDIFIEKSGFSWRKTLTANASIVFSVSTIGYLIANGFSELPASYQAIIAGVFAFYFAKDLFSKGQQKEQTPEA